VISESVSLAHLSGNLTGAVDWFVPPRLISGWVKNSQQIGEGNDIFITAYRGDRVVAEGRPTRYRPDIVNDENYLTAFSLYCTEDIPDEVIAFDLIRIEAHDSSGTRCRIGIWDRVKSNSIDSLFQSSGPLGESATAAMLRWLGTNPGLNEQARQAILNVHDQYFEDDNRRLMFQFESLGKDCSLGSVQRAYGAEPLGLFRFSGLSIDSVINAMQEQFFGIGSAEFTRLEASDTGEYYSKDTRYYMSSHTFVYEADVDFESFYKQYCKKLQFLVRNILEKLREGEKIFVIHAIPDEISDVKLHRLFELIQGFGTSRLLYLQVATEQYPTGTIIMRDDGIMAGYTHQIQGELIQPTAEVRMSWINILRKASKLVSLK
jgi:hypothetical protein